MVIGICGGGQMGSGIAFVALQAGCKVLMYDVVEGFATRCTQYLEQQCEKAVKKKLMKPASVGKLMDNITFVPSIQGLKESEIVIEAIIEDKKAKQELFAALESVLDSTTIIASNTSSISITSLARELQFPERFVGMHFFNPVPMMKLIEVIQGVKTSPAAVETIITLTTKLGKTPAVTKDVPGFIVNRVARSYYLESMRLVEEQAVSIEQVDKLMKSMGFKMGPFELVDLIGVDTNYAVTLSVWEQYYHEPRFAPAMLQKQYVDAGLLGRKTGEGFYPYPEKL